MTPLLVTLLWVGILTLTAASLCLAVLAWRTKRGAYTVTSAILLLMALVVAAIPAPGAPALVVITLGVLATTLAVAGGGPAVLLVLRSATRGSVAAGAHGGILVEVEAEPGKAPRNTQTHEVLRAGLTIGILERIAVAGSILGGIPAAVAVVVALKSVGRFTELDAAEARERFIIGTLVSLIWACSCAALVVLSR